MEERIGDIQKDALFKRLLSRNENSTCADCKSKGAAWVSIDFGVFVCINCSGVHRNFGAHITRVRSTKLDNWVVQDFKLMETVGNQVANLYWECGLKGKPEQTFRNDDERASFIKSKYISKFWVMKGRKDPVTALVDSNHTLKTEDLRAMYNAGVQSEPVQPKKAEKTIQETPLVRNVPRKKEESLIDFDFDPNGSKPTHTEKPKTTSDPFSFDLLENPIKAAKFVQARQPEPAKPQPFAKPHHDFTTSDVMFDFTKTTASIPGSSGTSAVNNGNIYNINNLTVLNQNFTGPSAPPPVPFFGAPFAQKQQAQQFPSANLNHGAHIDRYAVFDTFKLNYQHYNYLG